MDGENSGKSMKILLITMDDLGVPLFLETEKRSCKSGIRITDLVAEFHQVEVDATSTPFMASLPTSATWLNVLPVHFTRNCQWVAAVWPGCVQVLSDVLSCDRSGVGKVGSTFLFKKAWEDVHLHQNLWQ